MTGEPTHTTLKGRMSPDIVILYAIITVKKIVIIQPGYINYFLP